MKLIKNLLVLLNFLLLFSFSSFADGGLSDRLWDEQQGGESVEQENAPQPEETSVNKIEPSDASFDKRLPPVYPGELVKDSGKKKRVWSTSGPVPVSEEPEPWNNGKVRDREPIAPNGVSVILDQRKAKE